MSNLNLQEQYPCPVCRRGQIVSLTLMEAFSCNFCEHIFSADLKQQTLTMVDGQLPMTWLWQRKNWQRVQPETIKFGISYLIIGLIYLLFPTGIIALAVYLFPPLPGSPLAWLPGVWIALTFFSHLFTLVWLILEYYQFPVILYIRRLFNI